MQSDFTAPDSVAGLVMQLAPTMILQILYAFFVFKACRKQRWNAWLWTIASLVPLAGIIVTVVLLLSTILRTLDRVNALEGNSERDGGV